MKTFSNYLNHSMVLALVFIFAGCFPIKPAKSKHQTHQDSAEIKVENPRVALLADQKKAYSELHDGKYSFLVDFEPYGPVEVDKQVRCFSLVGSGPNDAVGPGSKRELTHLLQRTGEGALSVILDPGTSLIYNFPSQADSVGTGSQAFAGQGQRNTLLSMAILIGHMRDDLRITLISGKGNWTSGPTLLRKGWNQLLIDIQRLSQLPDFDAQDVRAIRFEFIKSADPVTFTLDDMILIDNYARVMPVPEDMILLRNGLDYAIKLPDDDRTIGLRQCDDGLWRLGMGQAIVKLIPAKDGPDDYFSQGAESNISKDKVLSGEELSALGPNRVGQVKVLENNPVRVRISNTWLFPSRSGQWSMIGIRHLRWIYTIYPDGRWVTDIDLNNAGGRPVGKVEISLDGPAAWAGKPGEIAKENVTDNFIGPSGKWSYMQVSDGADKDLLIGNYLKPGQVDVVLAGPGFARGDVDRDGFDESQGCYYLAGDNGHCRFKITPPAEGLLNPVFRIAGPWKGTPSVNREGFSVDNVSRLADGSAVFMLEGKLLRPVFVEVSGEFAESNIDKKE